MHPAIAEQDLKHILEHTRGLWDELRGQRVFLTGGTGFFGKWLVAAFCRASDEYSLGAHVHVLTRDPARVLRVAPELYRHRAVELHPGMPADTITNAATRSNESCAWG